MRLITSDTEWSEIEDGRVVHHLNMKCEGGQISYDARGRLKDAKIAEMFRILKQEISKVADDRIGALSIADITSHSCPPDLETRPGSVFRTIEHEICFSVMDNWKAKIAHVTRSDNLEKALARYRQRRENIANAMESAVSRIREGLDASPQ